MLSSVTVSLLLLVLGWVVVEGAYVNDFDQDARLECPANQIFSSIGSIHSNRHEDRRWEFRCKSAGGATSGCYWTHFLNALDLLLHYACPGDEVMKGMMSYHDNHAEDRRFMFQCCRVANMVPKDCFYTEWANDWDLPMNFNVPSGMAIKGAYSVHDNDKEDRRWQFYLCDVD